jgi:uncharacterized protein (TIGR02646 family)
MIKVEKDLENIPNSLLDKKTITRRNTCIRDGKYHQNKKFDQRFKQKDIQEILSKIYNQKCAFCEQKIIKCMDNNLEDCSSTVEHYRPKSQYYWLAFSWDNLLWCCHRCNQEKKDSFEVDSPRVKCNKSFQDNIHSSNTVYAHIENPKMVHPEVENIVDRLKFDKGIITSDDLRVKYTIDTCRLDRDALNEKRQTVIDDFIEVVLDKKLKNEPIQESLQELISDLKKREKEFMALRFWILKNYKSLIEESLDA